jgi:hypothetical protein
MMGAYFLATAYEHELSAISEPGEGRNILLFAHRAFLPAKGSVVFLRGLHN